MVEPIGEQDGGGAAVDAVAVFQGLVIEQDRGGSTIARIGREVLQCRA